MIFLLLAMLSPPLVTADESDERSQLLGFNNLCSVIDNHKKDDNPDVPWVYLYQTKIYSAAGVTKLDSAEVRDRKAAKLWGNHLQHMTCNASTFNVQNGSLLKFAISSKLDSFVSDAARWKGNLNRVDVSDNRTVLDYVLSERDRVSTPALKQKMTIYYDRLRAAGAKHRRELP